MHVLTKVFIVLVSLLSVLLVPLVVVYSHNEDSYKSKFEESDSLRNAANNALRLALRGMRPASYRRLVRGTQLDPPTLELRRWWADVRCLEIKLARQLWGEVISDLATMRLLGNDPPPEIQAEFDAIGDEAKRRVR